MEAKELYFTQTTYERIIDDVENPEDIESMRERQRSINIAAAQFLVERCPKLSSEEQQEAARLFEVAGELQKLDPEGFQDLWAYPMVSVRWRDFLRQADQDGIVPTIHCYRALLEFGAIVAAQAIQADQAVAAEVSVYDDYVMLPRIGAMTVPGARDTAIITKEPGEPALVHYVVKGEQIVQELPQDYTQEQEGWLPLRRIKLAQSSLIIDDLDPFRRCFGQTAIADRLTNEESDTWEFLLNIAWGRLISRCEGIFSRFLIEALEKGLDTIVPLKPNDQEMATATAASAVGAVGFGFGFDEQPTPAKLAEGIIHEFEHNKIVALLDILQLFEDADLQEVHYSAWRDDPRPIVGQFHGLCASIKIRDFWDMWRHTASSEEEWKTATFEYNCWNERIKYSFTAVQEHLVPTTEGKPFFAALYNKVFLHAKARFPAKALPLAELQVRQLVQIAEDKTFDHYMIWRSTNCHVDELEIQLLAATFLNRDKRLVKQIHLPESAVITAYQPQDYARQKYYEVRYKNAAYLEEMTSDTLESRMIRQLPAFTGVSQADFFLTAGNYIVSYVAYQQAIMRGEVRSVDWAGYLVAYRRIHKVAKGTNLDVITQRPEVLEALHRQLHELHRAPLPHELIEWLAAVI